MQIRSVGKMPKPWLALAGCFVGLVAVAIGISAGLAYRLEMLGLREAFGLLRWAAYGGAAGACLSLLGLARARPGSLRTGFWPALLGLVAGAAAFWVPYSHYRLVKQLPAIHDITTDTRNPPQFVSVLPLRPGNANSLDYGGETVAALQRDAYPDIRSLLSVRPRSDVFQAALDAAVRAGWQIVDSSAATGRIEAVDTTPWFGFRDDVIVRVVDSNGGTRVDVRSVSRLGVSDAGRNAMRVRKYLDDLHSRIGERS